MRVFFVFAITAALLIYSTGLWAPYHLDDPQIVKISETVAWGTRVLGFASFVFAFALVNVAAPTSSSDAAANTPIFLITFNLLLE